ncbi:hypothetical protein [Paracidovorax cattleyae]|uniref:Uncharacterized protein n=1 Tax=Paracidovorax cattleyae TaxID=80868 RepID=A0A1H0UPY5_9BURK|nr:hypothetical protein [Paracidovorax cattleyae]MBF9264134.1 hypothetical protein [Paracidovorax cattleyae]SDP68155.1 hypothetical protein SAMN04489708_12123 [Paracidovorax cattleyae]
MTNDVEKQEISPEVKRFYEHVLSAGPLMCTKELEMLHEKAEMLERAHRPHKPASPRDQQGQDVIE